MTRDEKLILTATALPGVVFFIYTVGMPMLFPPQSVMTVTQAGIEKLKAIGIVAVLLLAGGILSKMKRPESVRGKAIAGFVIGLMLTPLLAHIGH